MSHLQSDFTHVLITRPQAEAERLASQLANDEFKCIVQPAQAFEPVSLGESETQSIASMTQPFLLVFVSPRAVEFGLSQLPPTVTAGARYAAIGPATAEALATAGRPVNVVPKDGFTSESLMALLGEETPGEGASALVICAPGGRDVLVEQLAESGWNSRPVFVYERKAVPVDNENIEAIVSAKQLLTIFTSAQAMNLMSQRLPPSAWYAICRGDWLVISERLQRMARAFGASNIHLANGPGNDELATAIRSL